MYRNILLSAIALVASAAIAATDIVTVNVSGVTTSATPVTAEMTAVEGTPLLISFEASTNMSISVATVDGYGMSIGGARDVLAEVTNVMNLNTATVSNVYLKEDRLVFKFYSAVTNATATLKILIEQP